MYNTFVPSYQKYSEPELYVENDSAEDQSYSEEMTSFYDRELLEPADCIHALVEELYEASSSIDSNRIDAAMLKLVDFAGIDSKRLDSGLGIKHYSELQQKIEWHAGYTRALVDLSTHKKILGA